MKPLLKIETVPMQIECKLVNARVERKPAARPRTVQPPKPRAAQSGAAARQHTKAHRQPNRDTLSLSRPAQRAAQNPTQASVQFTDADGRSVTAVYNATARVLEGGRLMVDLQRAAAAATAPRRRSRTRPFARKPGGHLPNGKAAVRHAPGRRLRVHPRFGGVFGHRISQGHH